MPFQIVPRTDLSLAELARLHTDGWAVDKTPHVGNLYPNNLAVGAAGIPLLLVEQTLGTKDLNFHPHRVIVGGQWEAVSDPVRLTSHARITRASERMSGRFVVGTSLMEAHVSALCEALPMASIETTGARARRLVDLTLPFLEAMTEFSPGSWRRYVDADGRVTQPYPPQSWREVERAGIHGLTGLGGKGAGWIVPNAWNILGDGVIGGLSSGRDTVYALSGPDMIRYYDTLMSEMTAGYDVVRRRIGSKLPETLTMVMVPVAEMRLVTTRRRAAALDTLVDSYLKLIKEKRERGIQLAALPAADRPACVRGLEAQRQQLHGRLLEAVEACPEIFYRIQDATYLSQYDLLTGEELYVHPWGNETPMVSIIEMMKMLWRLRKPT